MSSMSACRQPAADAAAGPRGVSAVRHLPGAAGLHAHKRHSCTCLAAACTCQVWLDDGQTHHPYVGWCVRIRCRGTAALQTQCRYDRPHLQEGRTHASTPRDNTPRYTDTNAGSAVGLAAGSHKRPPSSQLHVCLPSSGHHQQTLTCDPTAGPDCRVCQLPKPRASHTPADVCDPDYVQAPKAHKKNPRQQQHVPNVHTLQWATHIFLASTQRHPFSSRRLRGPNGQASAAARLSSVVVCGTPDTCLLVACWACHRSTTRVQRSHQSWTGAQRSRSAPSRRCGRRAPVPPAPPGMP